MASNLKKKICLIGAFAVGKTSLVARVVNNIYSDKYHTTVGVKVDKKPLVIDGQEIDLVIWDLAGKDEFQDVQTQYMRGASGYLLVADGTRGKTLDTAHGLRRRVVAAIGEVPFVLLLNKCDLLDDWEIDDAKLAEIAPQYPHVIKTSAKTGEGVEEAFRVLAERMLAK